MLVIPYFNNLRARHLRRTATVAQQGMTLLEIMIVLAILGLVIGVLIVPNLLDKLEQSKEDLTAMEAKKLATETYTEWKIKNRTGCPSLDDLAKIAGKQKLQDQWGQPYSIHCGDNKPPGQRFGISSKGPDENEGTDDDIKSWEEQ
jgi:general secretion pathway protein G